MKDCWDSIGERFKPYNLTKYSKQSAKDAYQWLTQRFNNQPKPKNKSEDFKESEIYKFYETQLQTILSLNLYI